MTGMALAARAKSAVEVRLTGVSKRYGQVTAVRPLDLTVEAGTLVTLLGPSGCGKTTLLRLVAGLEQASSGAIRIGGRDVTLAPARERSVSMVFQSYALFPHMTVGQNVAYGLESTGSRPETVRAEVGRMLEMVGLAGLASRTPAELSGGQQQRVALARALVLEPDVLLFDEPLSNLDTQLRRQMRHEIRSLQQRLGMTVLYVTHDREEAMAVSDRIVVMRDGAIVAQGPPRVLYDRPPSAFVASFMGEANILDGVLDEVADGQGTVRVGETRLTCPVDGIAPGAVKVVLRPRSLTLGAPVPGSMAPALHGTVETHVYLGTHEEVSVATPCGRLLVALEPGRAQPAPGSDALVLIDPARATVVAR